jgi:cobalamin synthase
MFSKLNRRNPIISSVSEFDKRHSYWHSACLKFSGARAACWASKSPGHTSEMLIRTLQQAKRCLKIVFGFTLLALGVVMIVTPGPGWLTILLALGVLAAEFVWARRLLDRLKRQGTRIRDSVFPPANRAA